ncbi:MAG: hypothetical protein U9Q06_01125 [Nanoarchaeota archaeon]|nr:hypothetical protein [Nanoarchaeota archaeon]
MEIIKQFNNKLLNREEIVVTLESNATPSKVEVTKMISEQFKSPENQIVIEHILGKFGSQIFTVEVKIYDSVESLAKYETTTKKQRKKQAEEVAEAEAEAKKAKEETAKIAEEEVKEEPKPEEAQPKEEPKEEKKDLEEKAKPDEEPKEEPKSSEEN